MPLGFVRMAIMAMVMTFVAMVMTFVIVVVTFVVMSVTFVTVMVSLVTFCLMQIAVVGICCMFALAGAEQKEAQHSCQE